METNYATARDATEKALSRTREGARDAAKRAGDTVGDNPLSVLVGGIAVGALAGALLPRSKREIETLRPVGKKINAAAGTAAQAAKEAGKAELADLGLTKDAARSQATNLIDGVLKALTTAGTAAVDSRKKA
jgi:molecular chaperone DnaK (HSP70)